MGNRSIIELVRCYGGPVSHAALDPTNSIFQDGDIEGLITYRVIKCCAVVFGDPVCAPEIKVALLDAYTVYCNDNEWSIVYSAVSADMQIYAKSSGYASIEFAELMMTDPQQDPELGHQGHHLRQHLNFTRRAGVTELAPPRATPLAIYRRSKNVCFLIGPFYYGDQSKLFRFDSLRVQNNPSQ